MSSSHPVAKSSHHRVIQSSCHLVVFLLAGCTGVSQNPSYFPYLLPTGNVIKTHAKPIGPGYYANFDPHAVRLEVRPAEVVLPIGSQHVLIATVYDENGVPRRNRRVEWLVEGAGQIVEVDESGFFPGRGYKDGNRYAVSYTSCGEHHITRGNKDPSDDFVIRPGQCWCIVSSAVEGETYITVMAPAINNWEERQVLAKCRWVHASWAFPPGQTGPPGSTPVFTTQIFRQADRQPLSNYRVRYTILDGPDAVFLPGRGREAIVASDAAGLAAVTLTQVVPRPGTNHIGIEILRATDTTNPEIGLVLDRGETSMQWLGPEVTLNLNGPSQGLVGQDLIYNLNVLNAGSLPTGGLVLQSTLPPGWQMVQAQPPTSIEENRFAWRLDNLPPGQSQSFQVVLRPTRPGLVAFCAALVGSEGFREEKCLSVTIAASPVSQPAADVKIRTLPDPVSAGKRLTMTIEVVNTGTAVLEKLGLRAILPKEMRPLLADGPTRWTIAGQTVAFAEADSLAPGGRLSFTIEADALKSGRYPIQIELRSPTLPSPLLKRETITIQGN